MKLYILVFLCLSCFQVEFWPVLLPQYPPRQPLLTLYRNVAWQMEFCPSVSPSVTTQPTMQALTSSYCYGVKSPLDIYCSVVWVSTLSSELRVTFMFTTLACSCVYIETLTEVGEYSALRVTSYLYIYKTGMQLCVYRDTY